MLKLIEAAESKPVSLDDLKKHVEAADFDDDDDNLEAYLDAAAAFVGTRTGLTLQPSSWQADRCGWWSGTLQIRLAPVRSIVVKYKDEAGDLQTLPEEQYRWRRNTELGVAEIWFLPTFTSPALQADQVDAVQIEIEAGFDNVEATGAGDDPELVLPKTAAQAIRMVAAAWYRNREAVSADAEKVVPLAADALIWQLRVFR